MPSLRTERLELVAATLAHVEAELESFASLERLLGAALPASWPPGEYDRDAMAFFRERLAADPDAAGWYGWYAVQRAGGEPGAVVIGAAGFLGPPDAAGTVEVGYSIAPEFQARAFATEIVQALVAHAFASGRVRRVIAHAHEGNAGSLKVLERGGFTRVAAAGEPGVAEFERLRPAG